MTDNTMAQITKDKRTKHYIQNAAKKLAIEQQESHLKSAVISGAPEGWEVPAPLVAPVVLKTLFHRVLYWLGLRPISQRYLSSSC